MEPGVAGRGTGNRADAFPAHHPRQRGRRGLPLLRGNENPHFRSVKQEPVLTRRVPSKTLTLADGSQRRVVSVYDLVLANYGLDRGLEDSNAATNYAEIKAYRPGRTNYRRPRLSDRKIAREFADTAHKTHGRSMIILGAGVNHWYHMDMNYRGMINMLVSAAASGRAAAAGRTMSAVKAAPANRLAAAGLRAGLEPSAAPDEQHIVLLQPRQPVAL